jgi:predicted DsbA family dithiol-disulfide isomerase
MLVEIWSDIVCPWCYIGKRRFERGLEALEPGRDVDVVHRSFQLDPRSPRGQTSDRRQMLQRKYGWSTIQAQEMDERMTRTAAAEGLEYRLAGGVTGNTMDAHQLVQLARHQGVQGAVIERFYRAHFCERRSIFDRDSLVELAAEVGLDTGAAREALEQDTYVDAVISDNAAAWAHGVNGVPFFVIDGRYGISGAQAPEVFARTLEQAGATGSKC